MSGSVSDTPLTDAYAKSVHEGRCLDTCDSIAHDSKCPVCFGEYLIADFARRLELERADLRRALVEIESLLWFEWATMPYVAQVHAVDGAREIARNALDKLNADISRADHD